MHFDLAWAPAYRRASALFGVRPDNSGVDVDAEAVHARFGAWSLDIPRADIALVEITGPYRFIKTAGPAHLGLTDRGLTFASNGDRGVLMRFRRPLRSSGPVSFLTHPELTVTVADAEGLAAQLIR